MKTQTERKELIERLRLAEENKVMPWVVQEATSHLWRLPDNAEVSSLSDGPPC